MGGCSIILLLIKGLDAFRVFFKHRHRSFLRFSQDKQFGTKLARMFLQGGRASRCEAKGASVRPKTRLVATFCILINEIIFSDRQHEEAFLGF